MSTTTTNYGLVKPELTDVADITDMNPNWDTIDTKLKEIEQNAGKSEVLDAHIADKNNPHGVTAAQVGALPKDGSVPMNGNLTIERAGYTRVTQNNTATGATSSQAISDNGNSGYWNFKDANGVEHEIRMNSGDVEYKKDGTYHKLYGTHNVTKGTTDLTAGTSTLASGAIYLVYE